MGSSQTTTDAKGFHKPPSANSGVRQPIGYAMGESQDQQSQKTSNNKHARVTTYRTTGQGLTTVKNRAETKQERGTDTTECQRVRLDVHGRVKPLMRGWIHAVTAPLALAAGIVLICLARGAGLKWACAIFMTSSLILFSNSAVYHLGDWSPKVTDILRRIDHLNIFLLIAGTYTPVSFALSHRWRDAIIAGMWLCTSIAMVIHFIWISAPRWLYTLVYVIFGVSGVAFMGLFWFSPVAGPFVVILLISGGACYIAGAIVYALRRPDPWPTVFGFHEIFHLGTVAGYTCHLVAIFIVIVHLW